MSMSTNISVIYLTFFKQLIIRIPTSQGKKLFSIEIPKEAENKFKTFWVMETIINSTIRWITMETQIQWRCPSLIKVFTKKIQHKNKRYSMQKLLKTFIIYLEATQDCIRVA